MTIEEREKQFRSKVQEIGKMTYTQEMLFRFSNHWTEPDRAKGKAQKMKWEKTDTFEIGRRLVTWARNNFDKIQCYLTEDEKTIVQQKHAFAISLEPYLHKYGRDNLNSFYLHWTQVENKSGSTRLRWQAQEFWSLEARLEQWAIRNLSNKQ